LFVVPHAPALHVACTQSLEGVGQSAGVLHPASPPASTPVSTAESTVPVSTALSAASCPLSSVASFVASFAASAPASVVASALPSSVVASARPPSILERSKSTMTSHPVVAMAGATAPARRRVKRLSFVATFFIVGLEVFPRPHAITRPKKWPSCARTDVAKKNKHPSAWGGWLARRTAPSIPEARSEPAGDPPAAAKSST
jgi:hypothetical protein